MTIRDDIKLVRQVMHELKKEEEKLPEVSNDKQDNFAELMKLSVQKDSGFQISGDIENFTIKCKPDIYPILMWMILIFYVPVSSLLNNKLDSIEAITMFILLSSMLIYYRFGHTTYDINVDTRQRELLLKSNNLLGKHIKPETLIDYRDISDLSAKSIYTQLKGVTTDYNKIFLHYQDKKLPLIYLPKTVNEKLFIANLQNLLH